MKNVFLSIISCMIFVVISGLYLLVLMIINFSNINEYLWLKLFDNYLPPYISVCVFLTVVVLSAVLTFTYRKRLICYWKKMMFMTVIISTALIITVLIYISSVMYISNFNKDRWVTCPELRTYMISNLEDKYSLIGMHKVEIINLLGEPTLNVTENCYEYYIGSGLIDPCFYRISFEGDIVVTTVIAEH